MPKQPEKKIELTAFDLCVMYPMGLVIWSFSVYATAYVIKAIMALMVGR